MPEYRKMELLKADVVDRNGDLFTEDALWEAVRVFALSTKDIWITKEFKRDTVDIQGRIVGLEYDTTSKAIQAEVEILPTPQGLLIKELAPEAIELAMSGSLELIDCEKVDGVRVIKKFEITGAAFVPAGTKTK